MNLPRAFFRFCALLVVINGAASVLAATDVWITSGSGSYSDGANWSLGVPGASDNVIFSQAGVTYTVTFPGQAVVLGTKNYASSGAAIGSNTVTFAQSTSPFFAGSTYTVPSLSVGGPSGAPAILNTSLQTLFAGTALIGLGASQPGTVNVTGGAMNVTGSSADYELVVGNDGSGSVLRVQAGAQLNVNGASGNAVLGKSAGVLGTVNITGTGSIWNNTSDDDMAPLAIGGFGTGTLNITSGGQVNDFAAFIAKEAGSTGSVSVDGAGSTWTNRGTLLVGDGGLGSLTISNGGHVNDDSSVVGSTPGATGTVTVTGAGAKWTQAHDLRLGSNFTSNNMTAAGALHISAGGKVVTGGNGIVGSSGSGTATIDGNGSEWDIAGQMSVDASRNVTITAGAVVKNLTAKVAGTISVDEAGANWAVDDYVSVTTGVVLGPSTPGIVNVGDGAHASNRVAFIGRNGQVFVDGAGSQWVTTDQMYVGFDGGGQFNATGGALVTSGELQLGVAVGVTGTVSVDASTWTNSGNVVVGVAGTGTLTVSNGGTMSVGGNVSVGPRGTVQGNSHIVGDVRSEGTVAPGLNPTPLPANQIGTLQLDRAYTQTAAGTFDVQLASTASFDKLAIAGHATLSGELKVELFNGFTPALGNSFQILSAAGGVSGRFTSFDFPTILSSGHSDGWIVVYSGNNVLLRYVTIPTGDYNRDGVVDAADYTIWRDSLGSTTNLAADGDGNGIVDNNDYSVWKSNFGAHVGNGASSGDAAAVPEPRGVALLWVGLILLIALRAHCDIIAPASHERCGCEVIGQHVLLASNHRRSNCRPPCCRGGRC